jgi:hypothetical protein
MKIQNDLISVIDPIRRAWLLLLLMAMVAPQTRAQTAPNFGPNVYVFDSSMSSTTIQNTLNTLNTEAQFSTNHYAVLFKPGTYSLTAEVGYYEAVYGLGQTPQSVIINGEINSNQTDSNWNLTDNFWRSIENLEENYSGTLQWGVSQGADFRRMYVNGPLQLTNTSCGEASGGFIADSVITGSVNPCSQQQWYTRNSSIGSWSGGVWNMVFSGVTGAPTPNYPTGNRDTVLPTTPVSREKPFLFVDSSGNYNVFVPAAQTASKGPTWSPGTSPGYSLPISSFFIAQPSTTLAAINNALAYGQNLILTPGIYQYSGSINITNPNTIVLGLGFPTVIPQTGTAAITVADVDGVQLAGLLIDAGPVNSPILVQVGDTSGVRADHTANPSSLNDVFIRIGGATTGLAATSIEVDSNNVILDNIWAWRADHGQTPVGWTVNVANHGLVVNGDNVTALGLAVEHYQQNQVLWNGNSGETIFYQSELPYDVPSQSAWMNGSANGYASYAVSNSVTSHVAYGLGVYSYFNQGVPIVEDSAITVPNAVNVTATDSVSVFLAGSGQITATVNNAGTIAKSGSITSYLPFYQGVPCSTTCPATPTNLAATVISPVQINLTWTPSTTPAATYTLYRSTTSGFTPSPATQISTSLSTPSFADTTAKSSTTYYYLLEANTTIGSSAASNLASATTPANGGTITSEVIEIDAGYTGTTPPTHWVADVDYTGGSTGSVTHAITIPGGVTNAAPAAVYQTYRKGASFSYAIPNLTAGSAYVVNLHFADNFFATTGSREFNVLINGTQVLTNYDIVAAAGAEYTANVQSFYATADATGTITIAFATGALNSPQVNGIEIGLGALAVSAVATNLTASAASAAQINLNWTASTTTNVVYEVFRSTTSGFTPSPASLITTTSAISFMDANLSASTTYYYVVEANNSYLTSLGSNQANATTSAVNTASPTPPAAPNGLSATAVSSGEIDLLWTGSATPKVQYLLYRSTTAGFTPSAANLVTKLSATGFADTGLPGGTTFYYLVASANANGNSTSSNQATASTATSLTAAPVISLSSGSYPSSQSVTITDATSDAVIYYTIDGTTPTSSSSQYSSAISVSTSLTLQSVAISPTSGSSSISSATYMITGVSGTAPFVFVANANGSLSALNAVDGSPHSGPSSGGGAGVAIDALGYVWSIDSNGSGVSQFSDAGFLATDYTSLGVTAASALAFDGNSNLFIANGNGKVVVVSSSGAALSKTQGSAPSAAAAIAIDFSGNVWLTNSAANTVDEIIGGAAPTAPLANAVQNNTLGAKP